ncbi:MAG: division/cell wall cluster transcriptional repressor MraZ [Pseudobdellovibrionaceae bacterium]
MGDSAEKPNSLTFFESRRKTVALFLSTTVNKLDKKGRVSVPAPFRAALGADGGAQVILFRSPHHAALEGFAPKFMDEISARLDNFDLFSESQDDLATTIFGEAVPLSIDDTGRIVLPQNMIDHAGLGEEVAFVGLGKKFQIWSPKALSARQDAARKNVKSKGLTLPRAKGEAAND